MKSTLLKNVFFPKDAKFLWSKHLCHVTMGLPRPRLSPYLYWPFFAQFYLTLRLKLKRKCMDNGCLVSKHDSPQRISDFCRRLESKASALKASQDLVKNSRFLIFKNQTFNKGNKAT